MCYGYATWQVVRHRNADALGVGKALGVEHMLAGSVVLEGKLACSNLLLEPGKLVHRQEPVLDKLERKPVLEHKLVRKHKPVPEHIRVPVRHSKQEPVRKQVLEHRRVLVRRQEQALGMLEHKQVLELGSKSAPELGSIVGAGAGQHRGAGAGQQLGVGAQAPRAFILLKSLQPDFWPQPLLKS